MPTISPVAGVVGVGVNGVKSQARASYCTVTVICGEARLDVALPSAVACADLAPGLLRLLRSAQRPPADCAGLAAHPNAHHPNGAHPGGAHPGGALRRWVLTPLGRPDLGLFETLSSAQVLDGDVLILHLRSDESTRSAPAAGPLRDRIEDVIDGTGRTWTAGASTRLALWSVTASSAALLIPAASMDGASAIVALDVTVAVVLTAMAVVAGRRGAAMAAANGLVVACLWVALGGWAAVVQSPLGSVGPQWPPPGVIPLAVVAGAGAAALLAASALTGYPGALVHVAACGAITCAAAVVLFIEVTGTDVAAAAYGVAVAAIFLLGATPRVALMLSGLTAMGDVTSVAAVDARLAQADRMLTGLITGLSIVAVLGALPVAGWADDWQRLLAVAVGLGLLLRSRAFSQVQHVVGPRLCGLLTLGSTWLGLYATDLLPATVLVLGVVVVGASIAVALCWAPEPTAVTRARISRFLDIAELVLVVASVVLVAGVFGLFDWVESATAASVR